MEQDSKTSSSSTLSELPLDQLIRYGQELGLELPESTPQGEALRRVRERQELLVQIDRDAMLDIVIWMRRPVRKSASKETLAKEISHCDRMDMEFDGLSERGLIALAQLRGITPKPDESVEKLRARLVQREGIWNRFHRKRRKWVGQMVERAIFGEDPPAEGDEYRFLPEEEKEIESIQRQIEEKGVVGGIANRLRGVADDYIREKLDEIEERIDRKLDEIDLRLSEWRDREIKNRLRILKLTLIFSILVVILCLVYDWIRNGTGF